MLDLRSANGPRDSRHVRAHPAFATLVRKRRLLAWILTVAILTVYFGFIGLVAFAPAAMAIPVSSTITLGFPLGLSVIVAAIALTGIYVLRANAEFDRLTKTIVEESP